MPFPWINVKNNLTIAHAPHVFKISGRDYYFTQSFHFHVKIKPQKKNVYAIIQSTEHTETRNTIWKLRENGW